MSGQLILLFLFQAGLALAFTWFIARVLLGDAAGEARARLRRVLERFRLAVLALALVLPVVLFAVYARSLPEDQPVTLALWPAGWLLLILAGVAGGLTLALRARPGAGDRRS